jgi:hypothetical protein
MRNALYEGMHCLCRYEMADQYGKLYNRLMSTMAFKPLPEVIARLSIKWHSISRISFQYP